MMKKVLFAMMLMAAATSGALAQEPKAEITGIFGWSIADGVSSDPYHAANGQTYNRVDPKDSATFGLSVGFFVSPAAEIGFLWRRQPTSIEVSGSRTDTLGDQNIDGYHGYAAYYFGDSATKVRPYVMGGLGMTHYAGLSFTKAGGQTATISGNSQFSTTWGAGVKVNASKVVGVKFGVQWTPTYIKSDAAGWWCDPWWGCYVVGDAQYSNQFEFTGGLAFRF